MLLLLIVLLSLFIRWYRLSEFLFFGYEQGRDAMVIKSLYTFRDFTLIGPKTDIAGIFHGPWYYYLMTLPYGLSGGNPLVTSLFLAMLSALMPFGIYLIIRSVLQSRIWALVASLLVALSFEPITYSRWLHHYAFSVLLTILFFGSIWQYRETKKPFYFVLSAFLSAFASQFEIVLVMQFAFVYLALLLTRVVGVPSRRVLLLSLALGIVPFLPLVVFDFRHGHIILNAVVGFLTSPEHKSGLSLWGKVQEYGLGLFLVIGRSLMGSNPPGILYMIIPLLVLGLYKVWRKGERAALFFFIIWAIMSFPLLPFGVYLQQLYVGTGLGWIGLLVLSMSALWKSLWSRSLVVFTLVLLVISWIGNLRSVAGNSGFFFVTIQDDLNYADQTKLLRYVHDDARGTPYRLVAFTIPYLHPEAWDYLHGFMFPEDKYQNPKLIYLVIESKVASYFEEKWIGELGPTRFLWETRFGKLRLQKRLNTSNSI